MFAIRPYLRARAREYAKAWAFGRNPLYENYAGQGGDCTNFISQCLLAGGCTVNRTPDIGWYYLSPTDRAAAWTGVSFFWDFMIQNTGLGPFGTSVDRDQLTVGDVIQLGNSEDDYYHTLLVTGFGQNSYLVAAHTDDSYDRPLDSYSYAVARYLHIEGFRIEIGEDIACFENLLSGNAIPPARGIYVPAPALPPDFSLTE